MKIFIDGFAVVLLITFIVWLYLSFFGKNRDRYVIHLPSICTMTPPASVDMIGILSKMVKSRKKLIYLDIGDVQKFDFESYIVILAQAEKSLESGRKIYLSATTSLSRQVRNTLMTPSANSSTYHQHLTGDSTVFIRQSDLSISVLDKIEKDLKRIGIRDYYDLNTMITEIIGNALEHGIKGKNINWWMHHYVERGVMKIIFVDMGLGILASYRNAGMGRSHNDAELILDVVDGKLGSSTREKNRGRGLPQIGHMARNNFISDFVLTTNGATLRLINSEYVVDRHRDFAGTYYSWTVNKENFSRWHTHIT